MNEQFFWTEKYRPKTIDECILPEHTKNAFLGFRDDGKIPNILMAGTSGVGKTTVAKALCDELNYDTRFINASDDRGIDLVRVDIPRFASSVSLMEDAPRKAIILDEADNLTFDAQPALRGCLEKYSANCTFIFTCNFKNKIIEALHSRCTVVDFTVDRAAKKSMLLQFAKRSCDILQKEGVEYDKKVVVEVVKKYFPDYRRTLNELYRYAKISGTINEGILSHAGDFDLTPLLKAMKSMEYNDIREWVVANMNNDPTRVYKKIYDSLRVHMNTENFPKAVLILADYQYKAAFAADQELNLLACITELLVSCELK